jgi:BTB/POZ domain
VALLLAQDKDLLAQDKDESEKKMSAIDVGGHTHIKVSYSLLKHYPTTMLARLVDDNWKNEDKVHFIDRNGERFQYIL